MTQSRIQALVDMEEEKALEEAKALLQGGGDPMKILEACSSAMEGVGKRFESGEYLSPPRYWAPMFSGVHCLQHCL